MEELRGSTKAAWEAVARVGIGLCTGVWGQARTTVPLASFTVLPVSSWVIGNWSDCSRSCNEGVRTRSIFCKRKISATEEKTLDDASCTHPRPKMLEPCNNQTCPPEWVALDWSEVSA